MSISDVIGLLCGAAMFLFGMTLMGDGLKQAAGSRLELTLNKLSGTPLKGILLGTGVTAVIQSSSATSVMAVGFVNSGMMKFKQSIGIVLGAILGTSITGWIVCLSSINGGGIAQLLSSATITGVVAVVGICIRLFNKKKTLLRISDILLGFAVLMLGISTMSSAVEPLKESPSFINALTTFSNPVVGILVGAAFTCVLQSASASVGILQALTATGAISFSVAFPLILGIAIGAAFPVVLSAIGAGTEGKRTAFVYLFIEIIGAAVCGIVYYSVNSFVHFSINSLMMSMVSIALLNTIFRFIKVIILCPFISQLEKITCLIIKDKKKEEVTVAGIKLEDRFIPYPALSVAQCRTAMDAMATDMLDCYSIADSLLSNFDRKEYEKVLDLENKSDSYEDSIGTYLMKITGCQLSKQQNVEVSKFLHSLSDFERITDHSLKIADIAMQIYDEGRKYSPDAREEMEKLRSAVQEIVILTVETFVDNNPQQSMKIEALKNIISTMCDVMKSHHVERLRKGVCTLSEGETFNDLLTDFERVSGHCSNIGLAVLEAESDSFNTHKYTKEEVSEEAVYKEYAAKYAL